MIRNISSYPEILVSWERMHTAVSANPEELADLQPHFDQLKALLDQGNELAILQDKAASERQLAAKQLQAILREGQRLATFLRQGLKVRFGPQSARLVEFGIQPERRRGPRVQAPAGPKPEPTVPSSPTPSEPTE
jgi:hypothetical protein